MGFEWPLETEPAEALPINANDFLGAWQTGANSPSGRQSAQSTAHASPKAVWERFTHRTAVPHRDLLLSRFLERRFGTFEARQFTDMPTNQPSEDTPILSKYLATVLPWLARVRTHPTTRPSSRRFAPAFALPQAHRQHL